MDRTQRVAHIASALTSFASHPLPMPGLTIKAARSRYAVTRKGAGWDRWLQGFQLANGEIALSVALQRLQIANTIHDPSERETEMDWWADVIAFLRLTQQKHKG